VVVVMVRDRDRLYTAVINTNPDINPLVNVSS